MQQQQQVVVLDNGAGSIKLGFAGEANPRLVFPNCTAKAKGERQLYVGDALLEARELGGLVVRRPHDRGFLANVDLQRDIWARAFSSLASSQQQQQQQQQHGGASGRSRAVLEFGSHSLLLTEPFFNFESVQAATEEVVFEEFGFNSMLAAPAPFFSLQHACSLPVVAEPLLRPPRAVPGVPQPPEAAAAAAAAAGAMRLQAPPVRPLGAAAAAALAAARGAGAGVVVDAGFSCCYAAPFFDGQPLMAAARRLNLGGKALTNLLKETVSYRSLNVGDEGLLVEQLKDQLCWVSKDVLADLRLSQPASRSPHKRDVVLPDGVHNLRGYVKPPAPELAGALLPGGRLCGLEVGPWPPKPQHLLDVERSGAEQQQQQQGAVAAGAGGKRSGGGGGGGGPAVTDQVLTMNNELFMVPEALFRPSDIGLRQAGLPEVVQQAVAAAPAGLAPLLYGQVLLTGGCCRLPGFAERFESELRALVPDSLELVVLAPQEPELTAWRGASGFAAGPSYWQCVRTKAQYEEQGAAAARRDR